MRRHGQILVSEWERSFAGRRPPAVKPMASPTFAASMSQTSCTCSFSPPLPAYAAAATLSSFARANIAAFMRTSVRPSACSSIASKGTSSSHSSRSPAAKSKFNRDKRGNLYPWQVYSSCYFSAHQRTADRSVTTRRSLPMNRMAQILVLTMLLGSAQAFLGEKSHRCRNAMANASWAALDASHYHGTSWYELPLTLGCHQQALKQSYIPAACPRASVTHAAVCLARQPAAARTLVFAGDSVTSQFFGTILCGLGLQGNLSSGDRGAVSSSNSSSSSDGGGSDGGGTSAAAGRVEVEVLTQEVRIPPFSFNPGVKGEMVRMRHTSAGSGTAHAGGSGADAVAAEREGHAATAESGGVQTVRMHVILRLVHFRESGVRIGHLAVLEHHSVTARAESLAAVVEAVLRSQSPMATLLRPARWVVNAGLWHALCYYGTGKPNYYAPTTSSRCNDKEYAEHVASLLDVLLSRATGPIVWRDTTATHVANFNASSIADERLRKATQAKFAAFGHNAILELNAQASALIAGRYGPGAHPNATRLETLPFFYDATKGRPDGMPHGDSRHYAGEVLETLLELVWLNVCGSLG